MWDFTVGIAGHIIRVQAMFESTKTFCKEYLCSGTPDFTLQIDAEDIRFERERNARTDITSGRIVRTVPDSYFETLAVQRKLAEILLEFDILLFHGSVVAMDGEGYLFTAKSGTGKSTHTRLWREAFGEKAVMINDDKPFLHICQDHVTVYGSPWNGKHGLGINGFVPLKAFCILERSQENAVFSIPAIDALPMLMQQSQRPKDKGNFPKYMELIDYLTGNVAFYRLKCNMELSAAIVSYEGMR